MLDATAVPAPAEERSLQDRISILAATVYQFAAVIIFAIVPILAINWIRTPFLGVFVENTMLTNGLGPRGDVSWDAHRQGLDTFGWQIQSVAGQPVRSPAELQRQLRQHQVGELVEVQALQLPGGEIRTMQVTLSRFPVLDQLTYFLLPYLLGLIYLIASIWVFNLRRGEAAGRAFVLFATSIALTLAALFDAFTTSRLPFIWSGALYLAGSGLLIMAVLYPREAGFVRRYPILRWVPLLPLPFLFYAAYSTLFDLSTPLAYNLAWRAGYIFGALAALVYFATTVVRRFRDESPIVREQARMILVGGLVAFSPLSLWFVLQTVDPRFGFTPLLLIPLVIFPLAHSYAILRYRFVNTDFLLSRAFNYAGLTILAAATYVLLAWGAGTLLGQALPANSPLLIGLLVVLLAIALIPLRERLQGSIDAIFFRGQTVYQERLQEFSRRMTEAVELPGIIQLLRRYALDSLQPESAYIYLLDPLTDQYLAAPADGGGRATDIRFSAQSALTAYLSAEKSPLFVGDPNALPRSLKPDRARLVLLGAQLFVPLLGRQGLAGWLALGPRSSGEPYDRRDLSFLQSLCDQAALAIERAQVVFDLQRRVHEMNVLGRIAQGVNVTLNFDDILELIYAQTVQVLEAHYFRITVFDDVTDTFRHAFYLDGEDRLTEKEGTILPVGFGLEQEVVRTQRPILTEDYDQECRRRGVIPTEQGLYAWVGVPLNTDIRTIGAISLGSRDPAAFYTTGQQNLLQSIADQAAGAIVKTQLLNESEQRAFQLTVLNQVARSLTSELELDPLLKRILESAVEILNCEAGSLFLLNKGTGELVFEVVVGGAQNLLGMRLPPGAGLVGKAVEERKAIIDNNVHQSKDWFEQADRESGFKTRSLLVVPMQVRDEIIGVIEVMNKRDHAPFTAVDEGLLSAFSAQAGIAVENARLFTMTDQALAARVEELSVMQRIDRELNASLDLSRAMHITLDWAMRQSDADSGVVAVVEETGLEIKDARGYDFDFQGEGQQVFVNLPVVQDALFRGRVEVHEPVLDGNRREHLSPDARSQIAAPIQREGVPIGLILMESATGEKFTGGTADFLTRLTDHAAIAIANAQFYAEVQEANIAKSDFISFVSHELKTPMTSIKGYADLLSAGAVGEVNEAQAGFLSTIRTNVDRMATLVSDLTDISRIEAGRLNLEYEPVSLEAISEEVLRSVRGQIDQKEQILEVDIPESLPEVWGDRTRLVQVMVNLLSNAYKYTPAGGRIDLEAGPHPEWNGKEYVDRSIKVTVRDTGIGIKPEDQEKIFTKFFRSDDQKAREAPGTGLGLNITKSLVDMQGGRIWFESEYGKGTSFHFTMPIAELE